MKQNGWILIFGYSLLLIGFLSIILSIVGLKIKPLAFIDQMPIVGLVIKVAMILTGGILMYFASTQNENGG